VIPIQVCEPRWFYEHGSLDMLIKTQGDVIRLVPVLCAFCFLRRFFFYFACTLIDPKAFLCTFIRGLLYMARLYVDYLISRHFSCFFKETSM
jgi:hypothetical protein